MLKQIKLGLLSMLVLAFLASCNSDTSSREQAVETATGTTAADQTAPANVVPTANAEEPTAPVGPTTSITFEETEFNYGKVKDGEKVRHEYKFTNTGKEPLIITNAKGSCGCTVPEWPKEPIAVGGTGKILVEFDSKGKTGPQTKNVTVTANTDPPQTIIYIKGEVIGSPATTGAAAQ